MTISIIKTTKIIWDFFILEAIFVAHAFSQNINKAKLDSLFDSLDQNHKAMGTITISKCGSEIYNKSIGYSFYSRNKKVAANEKIKYRIASVSKIFTATLIFQLIEENKISLSTALDTYFPQIPNSNLITIANLLNHRSGLENLRTVKRRRKNKSHEKMLAIISKVNTEFLPGSRESYSNANYLLLGYIIEKIYNDSYKNILYNKITSTIGLQNTCLGNGIPQTKNDESFSYKFKNKWRHHFETDLSIAGGSGGVVSTASDLVHFIEALFSNKLINKESLFCMTNIRDGYGMGILPLPFYSKLAYGHYGGIDTYSSLVAYFPKDSLAIACCTNTQVYPIENIVSGALSIYYGRDYIIPDLKHAYKAGNLKRYTGLYTNKIIFTINISKKFGRLIAMLNNNLSFPLNPIAKDRFEFQPMGLIFQFNSDNNEFVLEQEGTKYLFAK